jgi:hypothetical protein
VIFLTFIAGVLLAAGAACIAVRRHRTREATGDAAARDLYGRYLCEVEALTHAYLLRASPDEEWLAGIKKRAIAANYAQTMIAEDQVLTAIEADLDLDADLAEIIGDPSQPGTTRPEEYWQPALTRKEAARIGISSAEYDQAFLYARMAVEEHPSFGTARGRWEPTLSQNDSLAAPFITDGDQELASRLEREADPALDKSQGLIENITEDLDEIIGTTRPIISPETGAHYSAAQAVDRVEQYDMKLERDEAVGKHHHRRASVLFQRLVSWAPWVEAVGFLTFVDYYLNVPLLRPWQNWLGWSFAATVVLVIIAGQTWLVRRAARSHNHAREARADGNRHEAEQGFTRRNRYLGLTAMTAAAITSGMIWRGTVALVGASLGTTALMIFVAAVTGLLLPTLTYLGIALDGSTESRDRDSLAADLDDDLDAYLETIDNSRRDLARIAEIGDTLRDKTFPDICNTTQATVDSVYDLYDTVRLLIGGLSADPPSRTTKTIDRDAAGNIIGGYIGTSIPGTGNVSLHPLLARQRRLAKIETQRTSLLSQIDALPSHPWGKSPRVASLALRCGASTRRSLYGRDPRTSRLAGAARPAVALVTAVAAAVALAVGFWEIQHAFPSAAVPAAVVGNPAPACQFIYTAPTANDARITLPSAVQSELLKIGLSHESIALTRVGYDGNASTSVIDMTPRTGNSASDPVLKVNSRAVLVVDAKISEIQTAIDSPAAAIGGQALYAGLTRTDFTGAPVTIISSGLDLANPDNFRSLRWAAPPEKVVADVKKVGALPTLHGPVTFVIVPTAGPQPQLAQAQKDYLKEVWSALLKASGATTVTFIDANGTTASYGAPSAPTVPVP